jgi:hypothetical protein
MLPKSEQHKQAEMDTILQIAKHSGYPQHLISKINLDTHHTPYGNPKTKKIQTCITFTYHSPLIQMITSSFKHTYVLHFEQVTHC